MDSLKKKLMMIIARVNDSVNDISVLYGPVENNTKYTFCSIVTSYKIAKP